MINILMCFGYDGTNFLGYQKQSQGRTVQEVLEHALKKIFAIPITVCAGGRTDTGVHALKQYANFTVKNSPVPVNRLYHVLNTLLPSDIRVYWSREVKNNFHARYSALSRTYVYQLYMGEIVPPTLHRYTYRITASLDWHTIESDLQSCVGTHDFTSLSSENKQVSCTTRTILSISVCDDDRIKKIYVTANSFLWKMVRTVIGTCIDRGIHRKNGNPPQLSMARIIQQKDRKYGGTTAPARGLFLYDIQYNR